MDGDPLGPDQTDVKDNENNMCYFCHKEMKKILFQYLTQQEHYIARQMPILAIRSTMTSWTLEQTIVTINVDEENVDIIFGDFVKFNI